MRKSVLTLSAIFLLFLALLPLTFTMQPIPRAKAEATQPYELYLFNPYNEPDEEFIAVWEAVQNRPEIGNLAAFGNFSVLILYHVYATGGPDFYGEWWVIATSLEQDESGMIHQVVFEVSEDEWIGRYWVWPSVSKRRFNPVNMTEAARRIEAFIKEDPYQYWVGFYEANLNFMGPFALYFVAPCDFGITVVLSMITGRLFIAATGIWMGSGELLFVATGDADVLEVVDINDDQKIDIKDIAKAALAYGSEAGDPNWDPIADVTGPAYLVPDGKIDIRDIALIAKYYGINFEEIY